MSMREDLVQMAGCSGDAETPVCMCVHVCACVCMCVCVCVCVCVCARAWLDI